jgi:hypothetical protein
LVEHWDGAAWAVASDQSWKGSTLDDVTAIATDDVWAVGLAGRRPLIEHWDGVSWSMVVVPPISDYAELTAVNGTGPDDVWAAGWDTLGDWRTLVLHFDGETWTTVSSPTPGVKGILDDVVSLGPTEAWAVGEYQSEGGQPMTRLVERWDGAAWSVVPDPPRPPRFTSLSGMAPTPVGILAVGETVKTDDQRSKPWGVELSGLNWSAVRFPTPPAYLSSLFAVATEPSGRALAVGSTRDALAVEYPLAYEGCV